MATARHIPGKRHFSDKQAAKRRLGEIHANPEPDRDHHPHRPLRCECGDWVLTSWTPHQYRSRVRGRRQHQQGYDLLASLARDGIGTTNRMDGTR